MSGAFSPLSSRQYSTTWADRLTPRSRLLAAAAFAVLVVLLRQPLPLLGAVGAGLGLALSLRLPPLPTLRRIAAVDSFILVLLLTLPLTTPGEPLFFIGSWPASREGLVQAGQIAARINAIMLVMLSLAGTLDEPSLASGLQQLRVPHRLLHLLLLTLRYLDLIADEYFRLRQAMKARGFVARLDRHTLQSLGALVGMLLVRSLERSERILDAMKCRGFNGQLPLPDSRPSGWADGLFLLAGSILLAGLAWGEWL